MSKVFAHRELWEIFWANGSAMLGDIGGRVSRCFRATRVDVVGFGAVSKRVIFITHHFVGVPITWFSLPIARMQYGSTALIIAANYNYDGQLEVAKLLLRHGARVQHTNKVMWSKG